MSECVVRMERVPKNCDDGCWGSLSGECPWCDSIDGYKMVGNRPPNCPIIAVLPDGHGRLVDADALMGLMLERKRPLSGADGSKDRYRYMQWLADFNAIKDAKTIVPAEKGESKNGVK